MPTWLIIIATICSPLSIILSLYIFVDRKEGEKIKRLEKLETEMQQVKRITDSIDEYMQELLLDSLRNKRSK